MNAPKKIALSGVLIAAAFVLSWIERLFPLPLPIPGFKLGLANIITLIAVYKLSGYDAALIVTGRCVLSALLFGFSQFAFAYTGGLFALAAMLTLKRFKGLSPFGVSIAGATMHNVGQVTAAVALMQTPGVFSYLLFLLPVAIPTGFLTAFVYKLAKRSVPNVEH